jgi:hypothetical protein
VSEALAWIAKYYPTFVDTTAAGNTITYRFKLNSDELRLKIQQRMRRYVPHIISPTNPPTPTEILGFYEEPEDFTSETHNIVFIGRDTLDAWINSLSTAHSSFPIMTNIALLDALNIQPFVYKARNGNLYIVQNMKRFGDSDFGRALFVAATWVAFRINRGPSSRGVIDVAKPVFEGVNGYVVYGIGAEKAGLVPIRMLGVQPDKPYAEVIEYGAGGAYAALLPLVASS